MKLLISKLKIRCAVVSTAEAEDFLSEVLHSGQVRSIKLFASSIWQGKCFSVSTGRTVISPTCQRPQFRGTEGASLDCLTQRTRYLLLVGRALTLVCHYTLISGITFSYETSSSKKKTETLSSIVLGTQKTFHRQKEENGYLLTTYL